MTWPWTFPITTNLSNNLGLLLNPAATRSALLTEFGYWGTGPCLVRLYQLPCWVGSLSLVEQATLGALWQQPWEWWGFCLSSQGKDRWKADLRSWLCMAYISILFQIRYDVQAIHQASLLLSAVWAASESRNWIPFRRWALSAKTCTIQGSHCIAHYIACLLMNNIKHFT